MLGILNTLAVAGWNYFSPPSVAVTFISVPTSCLVISAVKLPSWSTFTPPAGVKSVLPSAEVILTVAPSFTLSVTVVVDFLYQLLY